VPFSTIAVGRYANLAPAIWLYAGHILLIALIRMRMAALTPDLDRDHLRRRMMSAAYLAVSALLAIALSFVSTKIALWALALNFAQPMIEKWQRREIDRAAAG
jgi:hypothetical protein